MSVAQREYSISRDELLWGYTWEEILELVQNLPIERIVKIYDGMKKEQINTAYLETICDRDMKSIKDSTMVDFIQKLNSLKAGQT